MELLIVKQKNVNILLCDPDFLVVDKPAGIPTQPLSSQSGITLASWLAEEFPELKSVGDEDWGAVHRLDTETSGLVVFARNQKTYDYFRKAFSSNKVEKEYTALVYGNVLKPGKITWPIGSDPKSSKRVKVYKDKKEAIRGKAQDAITFYKPLKYDEKEHTTLLHVIIKTGRRHQIRAHLAKLGYPIIGDSLYGEKNKIEKRLFLHATKLTFNLWNGQSQTHLSLPRFTDDSPP